MELADEQLLEAWRAGDRDAGTVLFRRYFGPCRRFFLNKVPERDTDDLLQKTFTAMVESRERFRGDASFRCFVFSIARNVLLRYLRDFARRESKRELDFDQSSIALLGVTPGSAIALQRDQEVVRQALQQIPVHFQTILELSYWEGLDNAELAIAMDVEPTTVRTRLFRARAALAKALEGSALGADPAWERAVTSLGENL